jgi:hypothetical protein
MHSYIKKLRTKSEETRKSILLVTLVTSMAVVVFVWIYGLTDRLGQEKVVKEDTGIKPFSLFMNSISNTYDKIAASVANAPSLKDAKELENKQVDLIPVEHKSN